MDGRDVHTASDGRRQSGTVEDIHNAFLHWDGLGCIVRFGRNDSLGRVNCRSIDGGGDVIDAVVAMFGFTSGAIG